MLYAVSGSARMEFHVSRRARDYYNFDESLFSIHGSVIFANFHAARTFAQKMNDKRDLIRFPEQAVRAGQINAMGLIDEMLHRIVARYREEQNPGVMQQALAWLHSNFGEDAIDATLLRFVDEFPPVSVYRREMTPQEYLAGQSGDLPNREVALEEMLMLWLANMNPAFAAFQELFDDTGLERETIYPKIFPSLQQFFDGQPTFSSGGGDDNGTQVDPVTGLSRSGEQNLIDVLRSPALASPHSLTGQLMFLQQRWGLAIGSLLYRILGSMDLIKEEEKLIFAGGGPGPVEVYDFGSLEEEEERFTPDREWMPRLVLLAKNAYVWLDQLSKRYGRPIANLGEIPDEELDALARGGFTGLWLIGLWERSAASKTIKQLCGNPDAVASAYSLMSYQIAADLGGEAAYQSLRDRAWQRGIRLASDMVPNHMGIDSHWVMEHPDWFISLDYSPFPSYSFNGPDLSWRDDVGIYLEDHYYDRTDAAVVFKRVDRHTGSEQYIYHGNDGTSMPWNDTAQLNYLLPHVREAVIQTILHVARQFPIIRFDAAMTLAKKHIERLWFPEPGSGGAIASRADHAMSKAHFDSLIPIEFWREVVDRAAVEAPDTLLLAEAFWLMEGYFVRTLGMHRVYNSAFMNLLRDEDNAKYRLVMKNTLEFDPEILKRYVNFMNNPDERTAVDQFGKGDKYFGICTLMATMPGLPMFGHGQVEGFTEKYGMEYRRAYLDEHPDSYLVQRHEREIFPLLHRRYLFSGVEHFLLYDFVSTDGSVDEHVYAYSNRAGDEQSLVIYNNRYGTARGTLRNSVTYSARVGHEDERRLTQRSLGEGLGLHADDVHFCIFRDHVTGLEYIRSSKELAEHGFFIELGAYSYHVFLDIREVRDNEWHHYGHLTTFLGGQGVPSIDEALRETFLQPIHHPFRELLNAGMIERIRSARVTEPTAAVEIDVLDDVEEHFRRLLSEAKRFSNGRGDEARIARDLRAKLEQALGMPVVGTGSGAQRVAGLKPAMAFIEPLANDPEIWPTLMGWLITHDLGRVIGDTQVEQQSRSWIDEWLLGKIMVRTFQETGLDEAAAGRAVTMLKFLVSHYNWWQMPEVASKQACPILETWLKDEAALQLLQVNRYQGILWFNKEAFTHLLRWMALLAAIDAGAKVQDDARAAARQVVATHEIVKILQAAEAASEYRLERLLEAANGQGTPPQAPRKRAAPKAKKEKESEQSLS
jgi:glycosidase